MALAACPQKDPPGTTDDPENDDTTSDASISTSTAASTSSDPPGTPTGETTASPEPDATSTSSTSPEPDATSTSTSSTTTLDPDTTTGGDPCEVDVTISLALDFDECDSELVLVATVHNVGTADVPPGLLVNIYEGTDADGQKLATLPTTEPLPPGSSTDVVWVVSAGPGSDYFVEVHRIRECDETNNGALVTDAACPD